MKRVVLAVLITVWLLAGIAVSQQRGPYTLSVDVDLVALNVHVTSRDGKPVTGLTASNFQVRADGRSQEISFFTGQDAPATVGLIVDISRSMSPKWTNVRTAVASFANDSNPLDEMFILQFNEKLHWPLGDKGFTTDVGALERAMAGVQPSGTTALYDALAAALEHSKNGKFEKKMFVVISDGGDNSSDLDLEPLLLTLQQANVTVYCVGIYDPDAEDKNPGVLKQLASVSGGEAFFPKNPKAIQQALDDIANGIRNQYTLGFYPQNPPDGRYHKLSVSVEVGKGTKAETRTRPGYVSRPK